jgi:hypothetical protein
MVGTTLRSLGRLGLVLVLLGAGCSGARWKYNDKVEGTVKLDGVPVANVLVQFVPDDATTQGPSSQGYTDAKGHFTLKCENDKPGAVLGKHNVVVFAGRAGGGEAEEDRDTDGGKAAPRPMIPALYTIAAKTPLKKEVTADQHTYDLELESNPGMPR